MSNAFKPKRSATASKVPTTTELPSGELGVNMADKKIYINNGSAIVQVGSGSLSGLADVVLTSLAVGQTLQWNGTNWVNATSGGGGASVTVSDTAPSSPAPDSMWWDSTVGQLRIYYNDGTSSQWVDAINSQGLAGSDGVGVPTGGAVGQVLVKSSATDFDTAWANNTSGTVTSVGGTGAVSGLTLSGTVTSSGNLTLGGTLAVTPSNFASQTANTVLAAPNNAAGVPTFRNLTLEDLPDAWVKKSVRAATTANITLSGTQTIDGISVVAGDRVLVKNQTTSSANGIYVVAAGSWTRSLDADTASELAAAQVGVDSGTVTGGLTFDCDSKSTDTIGTTAVTWNRALDTAYLTTVGNNFATLANPNAVTFARINADNTVSALDAATFRTAIGVSTGGGGGVVTTKETVYTTGSSLTFTTDPKTLFAQVYCTGGGGGGGSADSDGTSMSASGGGGGGGTAIMWYTADELGSSALYSVGTGGTATSTAGGDGLPGGASTFNPAGTGATITGGGGTGGKGTGSSYGNYNSVFGGGSGGAGSGGQINTDGVDGHPGFGFGTSTTVGSMMAGNGGSSFWGGGGNGPTLNNTAGATAGAAAAVRGAGGSGSVNNNATAGVTGGAGQGGVILIIEYLSA